MTDFTFPTDVKGWLTEVEGAELARLAKDRRVLEIGSYCGLSTCCIGQTAKSVRCIDPFDGRATDEPRDTYAEFLANVRRYNLNGPVSIFRGTTRQAAAEESEDDRKLAAAVDNTIIPIKTTSASKPYDMAFVDGAHDRISVLFDYAYAVERLAPGGIVAFHDYNNGTCPGVEAAVNSIIAGGAMVLSRAGSVLTVKPRECGVPLTFPFLGIPGLGEMSFETHQAACDFRVAHPLSGEMCGRWSALTGNFNHLYANALNLREERGVTHFVMLHTDVGAKAPVGFGDWASMLIAYMRTFQLGVISAACRIKDDSMETSTAVETANGAQTRLKLDQIGGILCSNAFVDGQTLLINTGCIVVDLTQPWSADLLFTVGDKRKRGADGRWAAHFDPEDWRMSRWLKARGVRYGVTTDVRCQHIGRRVHE